MGYQSNRSDCALTPSTWPTAYLTYGIQARAARKDQSQQGRWQIRGNVPMYSTASLDKPKIRSRKKPARSLAFTTPVKEEKKKERGKRDVKR